MADPKMAPAADTEDQMDAMAPGDGAEDMADSGDQSGQVLCTIMKNDDGTYSVMEGDEPDGDKADMGGDMAASKPKSYSDIGQTLKAVMDCLTKDQDASGASADDQFKAGFGGDKSMAAKA